jgi:SAM-dependent methyltransferase
MKTADRFSNRVANYVKFRPGYPTAMMNLFTERLGLTRDSSVADIGCGPGNSSVPFVEFGCRVFGVEPNEPMRRAASKAFSGDSNFVAVDGSAQDTGLEEDSIDIVVAGQAFHWFNESAAVDEIRRIVKPGGYVALIWNERKLDATPFLKAYEELLIEFGTDYQVVRHDNLTRGGLSKTFGSQFELASYPNTQVFDLEGITGRLRSSSYTPAEDQPAFRPMIQKLETIFAEHEESGRIQVLYDTNVFFAEL